MHAVAFKTPDSFEISGGGGDVAIDTKFESSNLTTLVEKRNLSPKVVLMRIKENFGSLLN
jgi:hypothetical protein